MPSSQVGISLKDFQTGGVPAALKRDATDGVQSVHVEVKHPDEINTLFDGAIVYAKRKPSQCTCFAVGSEMLNFAKGLHAYFENTNTATPLVVTFGMPSDKHQVVMLQPSWILGWNNLVIQFSLSKLKMTS